MYKRSKTFVAGYKCFIGVVALMTLAMDFASVSTDAWRFFGTFLLILTTAYFLISAAIIALSRERKPDYNPCPMLEGLLITSYILQLGTLLFYPEPMSPDLPFLASALLYFVVPILIIVDQILLNRKGAWRASYPVYWLALPVAYAAWIILSAEFLPPSTILYPLHFLDVTQVGIYSFCLWSVAFMLLDLLVGFSLFLADFIVSGRLAKRIVLPHVRVVELSEKELQ